nr:MAG TPA: hypothetical protein [Caudoviricetes sp.]
MRVNEKNMCKSETDIEAIKAAKILVEYCKNNTDLCNTCPFYAMDSREWSGCVLSCNTPEDWEIEAYE